MAYLDNAATTKVSRENYNYVRDMLLDSYANPSSIHSFGVESSRIIDSARTSIADRINCKKSEVYFTSGGTESNNLAINGIIRKMKGRNVHVISTGIEHSSIFSLLDRLSSAGEIDLENVKLDSFGRVDLDDLKKKLRPETVLVSIGHVNSEIGTIQDIYSIGAIVKAVSNAYYHVDAVQSFGKFDVDFTKAKADLMSISGHKIHAFKGIGALIIRSNVQLVPVVVGGSQQSQNRPGTENLQGIVSMYFSIKNELYDDDKLMYVDNLRKRLINNFTEKISDYKLNSPEDGSSFITSISLEGIKGEVLVHALERKGFYISTRSACSSRSGKISNVLEGIKQEDKFIEGTIRISINAYNTIDEIDEFTSVLARELLMLRKIMKGARRGR